MVKWRDLGRFMASLTLFTLLDVLFVRLTGATAADHGTNVTMAMGWTVVGALREGRPRD